VNAVQDQQRQVFLDALRLASEQLAADGKTGLSACWAVGYVRAIERRDLRHSALDGVLAALDEFEGRE
jgi:hypothetical protein